AALAKNNADTDRWLNEARAAGMKQSEVTAFQRDLNNARQKAAQVENERVLQQARAALRDGRLTDPAQENAAAYLAALQASDPNNAGLAEAGRDLSGKLLDRARGAVLAGKSPDADLALAKRWGADPRDITAVQQLQSAPKGKSAAVDPATRAVRHATFTWSKPPRRGYSTRPRSMPCGTGATRRCWSTAAPSKCRRARACASSCPSRTGDSPP